VSERAVSARRLLVLVEAAPTSTELFGDATVLERILQRLGLSEGKAAAVVVAARNADPIEALCRRIDVQYRATDGVAARGFFADSWQGLGPKADACALVPGNAPLVCAGLLDEMLDVLFGEELDVVTNHRPPSFPAGLELEVMRLPVRDEGGGRSGNYFCPFGNFSDVRVSVESTDDLDVLAAVDRVLSAQDQSYDYRDIINLATLVPEFFQGLVRPAVVV
jgi:spore coat polysaccharide biosynthesis protein SpsF (cytidylyltransferase family)